MASVLNEAYFHDETAAFAALEAILWPMGPTCPHCGAVDRINRLEGVKDKKGRVRIGLWKCYHCRKQLTVRKNTVFESSHLKLHQWFQVAYLMCSSKKGVSSHQLARTLGCQVKTAWFASHRIREAMRAGKLSVPFGTDGGAVEADETFFVRRKGRTPHAIRQYGSIDGVITSIGGRDVVHVRLESDGKQISGCETTREVAKRLRHHLYDAVRLFGRGRWSRDADGNWNLEDFRINDFEPLDEIPLSKALAELRAIPTEWDDTAYEELRKIRHGPEDKKNGGH